MKRSLAISAAMSIAAVAVPASAAVLAQSSSAPMPLWAQLVSTLGFPIVTCAAMAWYHVRVMREKDAEIKRLCEARAREAREALDIVKNVSVTNAEAIRSFADTRRR